MRSRQRESRTGGEDTRSGRRTKLHGWREQPVAPAAESRDAPDKGWDALVHGPRAGIGTWLAVAATAAALLIPLVLMLAGPRLAQPAALAAAKSRPALSRPAPQGRLDAAVTELPIVITSLPDAQSQLAAVEYPNLRVRQPALALTMFDDAWLGLKVAPADVDGVNSFGDYLLSSPSGSEYPTSSLHDVALPAVRALVADPRNADRLNNAAVALFDLGVGLDQGLIARQASAPQVRLGTFFEVRATSLLQEVEAAFPSNRAVLLNRAYLTSSTPNSCVATVANLRDGLAPAQKRLQLAGDDTTARLLVASLQARDAITNTNSLLPGQGGRPAGLAGALSTLDPLLHSKDTAGFGHAARGDAYLAAAIAVAGQAPYLSRRYADQARIEYQSAESTIWDPGLLAGELPASSWRAATAESTIWDPGLLAGEAAALDMLGDAGSALAAQREAVQLAPDSAELQLGLAGLEERSGDFRRMQSAAQQALTQGLTGADARFEGSRLVASAPAGEASVSVPIPGDRGFLRYSMGSDVTRIPVYHLGGGCGGGGFTVTNAVPALDDTGIDDRWRRLSLPDAAVLTAVEASLVLGDPAAATADVRRWKQALGSGSMQPGIRIGSTAWPTSRGWRCRRCT